MHMHYLCELGARVGGSNCEVVHHLEMGEVFVRQDFSIRERRGGDKNILCLTA